MMRRIGRIALVAGGALAALAFGAACAEETPVADPPASMTMTVDGPVLVTPAGMSLYIAAGEDMRAPKFAWACTNVAPAMATDQQSGLGERPNIGFKLIKSCVDKFPPYAAPAGAKAVGDFTIAVRPDGQRQWAYLGKPLYTSVKDHRPGERNAVYVGSGYVGLGRGRSGMQLALVTTNLVGGLQFVRRDVGLGLETAEHHPVYWPGSHPKLRAVASRSEDFQPIAAPALGGSEGEWQIVDAAPGIRQYAFRGRPLFAGPGGLAGDQAAAAGGWDPVVVVKAPEVPAAFGKHITLIGDVFTDRRGMTLYAYNCNANTGAGGQRIMPVSCEEPGDPAAWMVAVCGDGAECARRWHPYLADARAKPAGEFTLMDITYPMFTDMRGPLYPSGAPRVKVWAYRGKPLFTYPGDDKPGDIYGHNTAGLWGSGFAAVEVPGRGAIFLEP